MKFNWKILIKLALIWIFFFTCLHWALVGAIDYVLYYHKDKIVAIVKAANSP